MSITHFIQHSASTTVAWVLACVFLLQPCVPALAQTSDECTAELRVAEQLFYNGDFDKSVAILKECLGKPGFPEAGKKDAYVLLAQNYLAKTYLDDARDAIRRLLKLVPDFVPPPDSPELAAEVDRMKKEIKKDEALGPPPHPPTADFPQTWHYIVGGAVVGGVVAILLLKDDAVNGADDVIKGPMGLPRPPNLP